jgi:hypothetical protein
MLVDMQRQNTYLEALAVNPSIQIQYGHYLEKIKTCRFCGATWSDYEEKMTDVNIAVQLLSDAQDNLFDVALVCSGDSDLVTPVRKLRELYPVKQVIVVFPPGRHSAELTKVATASLLLAKPSFVNHKCQIQCSVLMDSIFSDLLIGNKEMNNMTVNHPKN